MKEELDCKYEDSSCVFNDPCFGCIALFGCIYDKDIKETKNERTS
jgi:hypothetical protein